MSNVVNKLIFNCLVQYGNVALPGVGSLQVVGSPKRVTFTTKISDNHIPVTDIIAEQGGMSDEQAAALYGDWLEGAKGEDGSIKVESVGVILPQSFQIAEELRRALGADEQEEGGTIAPLKKRCRCCWVWWLVAAVVVAAVVIFALCPCCNKECAKSDECEIVAPVDTVAIVEPEVVAEPEKPAIAPPAPNKRYNVAVGVFSIKYNARACAKQDPLGIGAENYTITPFPSGLWVVIAHATDNLAEAERMRKEYKKIQPDVWVYKRY